MPRKSAGPRAQPLMQDTASALRIRRAEAADLDAINAIVERAFMTWKLPERVKRLSLPSYLYRPHDLWLMSLAVAENAAREPVGVVAWEAADARDLPAGQSALLLHGLYVDPVHQRQGIGSHLLDAAIEAANQQGVNGLLVKAQADAIDFFAARGMQRLPVSDPARDYPYRFWLAVSGN